MRADRLLSILLQLQVNRRVTARELARRLEVSERTIHRDMEALGIAGVPVVAERGAGGGWSLLEEYRTNLTGLNRSEVDALFLPPSKLLSDLGLESASRAAFTKLLAAISPANRDRAAYASQRIHIDVTGWNRQEEPVQLLPVIQEALWTDTKLRIAYQRGADCDAVSRLVEPLGLVAKGSVWYLVASVDGDIRSYRVSRITDAALSDERFVRAPDFNLAEYWKQSASVFKEKLPKFYAGFLAESRVVPLLQFAGRFARIEKIEPPGNDGRSLVRIRFQFEEDAIEYALSFGTKVELVEPKELRARVVEMARAVVAFYAAR